MFLSDWLFRKPLPSSARRARGRTRAPRPGTTRLFLEPLEARALLSTTVGLSSDGHVKFIKMSTDTVRFYEQNAIGTLGGVSSDGVHGRELWSNSFTIRGTSNSATATEARAISDQEVLTFNVTQTGSSGAGGGGGSGKVHW